MTTLNFYDTENLMFHAADDMSCVQDCDDTLSITHCDEHVRLFSPCGKVQYIL